MEHSTETENSGNYGILDKPLTCPPPHKEYVQPNFLPKYLLLCFTTFCHILSLMFSLYTINEYAFSEIQKIYYPNEVINKSSASHCDSNATTKESIIEADIQSKVSEWSVYGSLGGGIPALIATSTFASLSDIYGRKRFLFLALLGSFLKNGMVCLGMYFKISIYWFILFNVLEGMTGSWIVTLSVSFAYIADLTPPGKSRTFYMTAYELILNFGLTIGALGSGFYIKAYGYLLPEITATGIVVLGLVLIPCLPESLCLVGNTEKKTFLNLLKTMSQFFSKEEKNRLIYIFGILAFAFILLPGLGKTSTELFYTMGQPFCLDAVEVSVYTTVKGVLQQFVGVIMIKILQCCLRDETIATVSTSSYIAYFIVMGLANNRLMLWIAPAAGAFSLPAPPMIRALMSKLTPINKQGSIFAVIAFVENICSLVGSVMTGAIYSNTVAYYRGFVFFILAGFNVITFILLIIVVRKTGQRENYSLLSEGKVVNS